MVNRAGNQLEFVGVRAVIQDLTAYLNGGKRIEAQNKAIAASSRQLQVQSERTAESLRKELAVQRRNQLSPAKTPLQKFNQSERTRAAAFGVDRELEKERVAREKLLLLQKEQLALDKARRNAVIGAAAVVVGAAAIAGIVVATKAAAGYETALAKIDNFTNLTRADTAALSKELINIARTVPSTPEELGATAYFALSSGIQDTNEALEITELSAKAAASGMGEAKDIASLLVSVINTYGETNITATQATDLLVGAVREGRAEADQFAGALGRVLPVAANLGVGFDELVATVAALTNTGLESAQAVTAVLGILNQLISPSAAAEEALESVGLSIEGVLNSIQNKGLIETLNEVGTAFEGDALKARALFDETRGLNGFISAFVLNQQKTADILDRVRNSAGAAEEVFKRSSETFDFQAKLLKNQLNIALIEVGSVALPVMTAALQDLIGWIEDNNEAITSFTQDGLKAVVDISIDVVRGLGLIVDALASIDGNSTAAKVSVIALGAAFVWALPGGPVIKGLLLIAAVMGEISKEGGLGDQIAGKINDLLGIKDSISSKEFRSQVEASGSIKGAINEIIPDFIREEFIAKLKAQFEGIDLTKGIEELDRFKKQTDDNGEAADKARIELEKQTRQQRETNKVTEEAAEELAKLASAFQKSSEAAGQVEDLTAKLGLFGEVTKELADALGLSATQAGNIQGLDAVAAAERRATNEAFNFTKSLATVARAFRENAKVAQEIVLGLARSALAASQAAIQSLLGQPSRELANLGVRGATQELANARTAQRVNPQVRALEQQLEQINKQIDQANKAAAAANKQQQASQSSFSKNADRQLAALERSHRLQENGFARANENLERLISNTQQQASDLQEAFLKSNESLQRQINEAIGSGDRSGALELVDEQQAAAKAYQAEAKVLVDREQDLVKQLDTQRRAQAVIERNNSLMEQEAEARVKAVESTFNNTETVDANTTALEAQRDGIQAQIDALSAQTEAGDNAAAKIQEQAAIYEAQTALLEAQAVAADNTLRSQGEQAAAAQILISNINQESAAVRRLATLTGVDLNPEVEEAARLHKLFNDAMRVLSDEEFRNGFIDTFITAEDRVEILGINSDNAAKFIEEMGKAAQEAGKDNKQAAELNLSVAQQTLKAAENIIAGSQTFLNNYFNNLNKQLAPQFGNPQFGPPAPGGGSSAFADGSIITRPTLGWVGEAYQKEAIIPLERPRRARQLMASIPPSVLASILPRGNGSTIFAPNISVRGETLDSMESAAVRAVQRAFRDARVQSHRSGGLISQGLGPSR